MPIYAFRCKTCGLIEEIRRIADRNDVCICPDCGFTCERVWSKGGAGGHIAYNPRLSTAMGVHPDQIEEAEKLYPGSKYTPEGDLMVASRQDKLKKMKERGYTEIG